MLAIDRFQALCSELIEHHSKNIEVLASIGAEQHQIATLGLINVIRMAGPMRSVIYSAGCATKHRRVGGLRYGPSADW